jgi:peroxiredoxin
MERRFECVLVAFLLLGLASSGPPQERTAGRQRPAPDFELENWQGKKVSLNDFRGKVVLLQFFQSGCPRCQQEAPLLERVYREYQSKGLVITGISHDAGGRQAVKKFASDFGITYQLLLGDIEVAVRYIGITPQHSSFTIPHYFLIDRQGTIVGEFPADDGKSPDDEVANLEQAIKNVLARSPATSPASTPSSN